MTVVQLVFFVFPRGESNGATGIFPKNFVDIVDESSVPSPPAVKPKESSFMVSDTPSSFSLTGGASDFTSATPHHNGTCSTYPHTADSVLSSVECSPSSNHPSMHPETSSDVTHTSSSVSHLAKGRTEPTVRLSNTSSAWKTIDVEDDDLFDDDYFKKNMPSLYSSKGGGGSVPSAQTSDTTSALIPASGASVSLPVTGSRYENVPVSQHPEESSSVTPSSQCFSEEKANNYRYENIQTEESQVSRKDVTEADTGPEFSAFLEEEKLNSFSKKVEDYLSSSLMGECDTNAGTHSIHAWPYRGPSYTEDNTGIEPYGRAVFSFKAQYPNELTFKKGEIVHLVQHVDSHWTLGCVGDAKGIFPTSYVDIIVDCLHSEVQHFLTRPETAPSATQLPQAVAQYDFQAVQDGDVSMKKGDTLTVLKDVDTNWVIVENVTGSKGMCPKNYLSFLKDEEPPEVEESQSQAPDSSDTSDMQSVASLQDSAPQRSRSSSPFSSSWQRRSYNKDDFGSIKRQDVEPVLARNIASLDATSKASVSQSEKKSSKSVFMQREMSLAEEQREVESQLSVTRPKPVVLPRQSKIPPVQTSVSTENSNNYQEKVDSIPKASSSPHPIATTTSSTTVDATSAITVSATSGMPASTTTTSSATSAATTPAISKRTGFFSTTRPAPPPVIPPRTKVFTRSNSLQSDSASASLLRPPPSPPQPISQSHPVPCCQAQQQSPSQTQPQPSCQPHSSDSQVESLRKGKSSDQPHLPSSQPQLPSQQGAFHQPQLKLPNHAVYSQVRKRSQEEGEVNDSAPGMQQGNDNSNSSASFPDDVSHLSVATEANLYSSGERDSCFFSCFLSHNGVK